MNNDARLRRLLAADGKCVVSAIDHASVNELRLLNGLEDMRELVPRVAEAGPDAILLCPGQADTLQSILGKNKPSLILRVDTTNLYRDSRSHYYFDELIEAPVECALRLDAAGVIVHLFFHPDLPELYHQCIQGIFRVRAECDRYGMPLLIEPRAMEAVDDKGYTPSGDPDKLVPLVRQAFELGADIVKADPTDDLQDFHRVVKMADRKPILALGGGKLAEMELLERTAVLMRQGAHGVVYGRNLFQQADPPATTRAVMEIVHRGATPAEAYHLRARAETSGAA